MRKFLKAPTALLLSAAMILSGTPIFMAEEDIPAIVDSGAEVQEAETIKEDVPVIMDSGPGDQAMAVDNDPTRIPYAVEGGNIYFNSETGGIVGCDKSVIKAVIPSTIGGKSVTSIGNAVFYCCDSLTSVIISDRVTFIGENVFIGCANLTSVEIPNSVTSIGKRAFQHCSSLTNIEIPNSVTSIEEHVFSGCSSLTSIQIPNSVTSIGYGAFSVCSTLTNIEIPNSVTSIGRFAFSGCISLTNIEIPNSVTSIGYRAFSGCISLTNIEIPNSVTSIEDWVFWGCSSLTSIEIPNSVTSIKDYTFFDCSTLTNIKIPNSVTSIETSAFRGCSSLTNIEIPNSVTSIETSAFRGCSSLTNIEIPNSVTSIGDHTFWDCSSLTSIEIPNSVTNIGEGAFEGCGSLTSIEIPNSVTNIGEGAFEGCGSLTSIEIPDSVTYIRDRAFEWCYSLTSVKIPNSVTSIGKFAFSYNYSLNSVIIPDSVTSIGADAFRDCNIKDIYYAGTESQWNSIKKDAGLRWDVTVHYNSTGPGTSTDPGIGDLTKLRQIRIVESYDAVNKKITFKKRNPYDQYEKTEFLITDETDISIIVGGVIGSLDSLAGKPVWVKFDDKTDTLLELKAVEPKFGDVSAYTTGSEQVTIGGISYTVSPDMLGTIKVGPICFWSADKEIVSVSSPVKKEGILQWWKPSTKEVKIGENIYQAGSLTDISFVASVDVLLNTRVNYWLKPDDAAWPDSEILRISSIDDANYEYKQFKNYDPAKKTVYYLDGSSHTVADGITLDVNGLENQWVRCKLERASGGYTFYLTEIKKLEAELRVNFNMDKKEMEYRDGKLRFAGETGYVNKTDFEIPFSIRVSYHLSGPDSALLEQIAKDESFKTTLKKIKIEEPSGFHLGWNVKFDKPVILRPGDKELEYKGFFKAGMFFNQKEEIQQYTVLGTAESDKGKTEFIENFQITNVLAEYGTDEEPSEWDIRFLKQLNEARDINVTAKTALLNQYFDKETLNDIGRQVDFWTSTLNSELMKQTTGTTPNCLELLCKMKTGDPGRLVFCYTNYSRGSTGTFSSVSFALMNDRSKNMLITNSVDSVIVEASPREFSAKIKEYLKEECGDDLVDLCKKLMKNAIKDTVSTMAKVSGKEYLESMMKLFNDYSEILENAKEFKEDVEDALPIIEKPMEYAIKPASYFNEFQTKHAIVKCPVDVYVYDGNKKLCGAIENNRITTDTSDVFLEVEGDQKGVWMGNDDYSVELVSTGSGTMHYIVEEYTGYNMKRDVDFRNVPLSKGITYQGNIPEPTNIPAAEYALISNTGEKIYANSDITYDPTNSSGSSEDTRYVSYNKGSSGGSSSGGGSGGSSSSKGQKPLLNGSLNSLISKKIASKGIISKDTSSGGIISSGKVYKGSPSDSISSNDIPSNNHSNSLQGNMEDTSQQSVSTPTTMQQTDLTQIKNANYISLAKLQKLASEAQKAGATPWLEVDTMVMDALKTVVGVRIGINPALANSGIQLAALHNGPESTKIKALFEKYFSNTIPIVIYFSQKGEFGQKADIAVKAPTDLNVEELVFYSYNSEENTYWKIQKPSAWIDVNGYLHFKTDYADVAIVSQGELTRRSPLVSFLSSFLVAYK